MPKNSHKPESNNLSRRNIISGTAALAGSASISLPNIVSAKPNKSPLKLGLIGCGGRGTGAANQALTADQDITLTSVADVSEANANGSINNLKKDMRKKLSLQKYLLELMHTKKSSLNQML